MIDIKELWRLRVKGSVALSLFLSVWCICSKRALEKESMNFGVLFLIEALFLSVLFIMVIHFVAYIINRKESPQILHSVFRNKWFPFILFFLMMAAWSYHVIVKYPAGNCIDSINQMSQAMGLREYSAHHPIFHTLLLKLFLNMGEFLGNLDYGLFLFVIVEAVVMGVIFCYAIKVMIDYGFSDIIVLIGCLFFMFSPFITGYIGTTVKDTYYSAFTVLFLTQIAMYVLDVNVLKKVSWHIILVVSTCGCTLTRHNGIYIIIPTLLCILAVEIIKKNVTVLLITSMIIAMILPVAADKGLEIATDAEKPKIRETLSLPMQQTARLVKYYPELVTDEEKKVISVLFPYDEMGDLYKENISDPVKKTFNPEATKKDVVEYLKVWFVQFFRKPTCYISATFRQNMYLLYPGYNNYKYYIPTNPYDDPEDSPIQFDNPSKIVGLQKVYKVAIEDMHKLPLLEFINNMANYVILFVILSLLLVNSKEKKKLILYLPVFMSILIVIAAPAIKGNVRYIFPLLWSFPIWAGIVKARVTGIQREEESK